MKLAQSGCNLAQSVKLGFFCSLSVTNPLRMPIRKLPDTYKIRFISKYIYKSLEKKIIAYEDTTIIFKLNVAIAG